MQGTVQAKDCRACGEALSELSASYFSCFSFNRAFGQDYLVHHKNTLI